MEQLNTLLWSAFYNRKLLVMEVKWNWDVKQSWNYIVWGDSCSIFQRDLQKGMELNPNRKYYDV